MIIENKISKSVLLIMIASVMMLSSCAEKVDRSNEPVEAVNIENELENNDIEAQKKADADWDSYEKGKTKSIIHKMKIAKLGHYEQDGNEKNGKEDIEWYLLYSKGGFVTLISRYILDCHNYNDEDTNITYENSTIRKWLNTTFFDEAFSEDEKKYIYNFTSGALRDNVGLLSLSDIKKYFGNPGYDDKNNVYDKEIKILSAKATDYAIKKGVEYEKNSDIWCYKNGSYHLMDTVDDGKKSMWIGQRGHVYTGGQNVKLNLGDGIRVLITVPDALVANAKSDEDVENEKLQKEENEYAKKRQAQLDAIQNEELHIEDGGETCYVHDYAGGKIDLKKYGKFKKLVFSENKINYITDMSKMFSDGYYVSNDGAYDEPYYNDEDDGDKILIEEVDFSGLDTSKVKSMAGLFNCNSTIKKVTFGDIDTSNVESMYKMFNECPRLEEVDFGNIDTSNVTNFRGMFFYDTNLKKVNISRLNTVNAKEMGYMFYKCLGITELDLSNFNTKNAENMDYMFANMRNLENINLSSFDTRNVNSMSRMFYRVEKLKKLDLSSFSTPNVKSMNYMFYGCNSLEDIDLSNFRIDSLTSANSMFYFCNNIQKLDLHNFVNEKSFNIDSMFRYCERMNELDISGLKLSKLDNVNLYGQVYTGEYGETAIKTELNLFDGCSKLTNIKLNEKDYNNNTSLYVDIVKWLEKNNNMQKYADQKISITNKDILYMDQSGWEKLLENEFLVKDGWEYKEFFNYYEEERYNHFPNYVTSDSMLHIFHLYFDYLMKSIEGNKLYDKIYNMTSMLYEKAKLQYEVCVGTDLEKEAQAVVGYFAVPMKLFNNKIEVPDYVSMSVDKDVENILNHTNTQAKKGVFEYFYDEKMLDIDKNYNSYFYDDYSQYKPRGHYDGDERLETYFRVFMWYGRTDFTSSVPSLSKCAMLINILLDDANIQKEYNDVKNTIYYFAGTSDDCGYNEYIDVIKKSFGVDIFDNNHIIRKNVIENDMQDNAIKMQKYISSIKKLKSGMINSQPGVFELEVRDGLEPSFRMIGQTYTIDAEVYQKLIYDYVKKITVEENGATIEYKRALPDFLDIPASFYSKTAEEILRNTKDKNGFSAFDYPQYEENLNNLRKEMPEKIKNDNSDVLYVKWLRCLLSLVETENNDAKLPSYMKKKEHKKKSLETFAGSYAELKHDTILYAKQTYGCAECGEGGMDEFYDTDDIEIDNRGYVEPQYDLYLELCDLADSMYKNFKSYDVITENDIRFINNFSELSRKLAVISDKELRNEKLTNAEYDLIDGYGATIEHLIIDSGAYDAYNQSNPQKSKAIVADVATTDGIALELGTGNPLRIYVLVNVAGKYKVCCGAAYDFYQFDVPATDRMTDIEWRTSMKFDSEMFDRDYDGSTDPYGDEEPGYHKAKDHDYNFQDWTESYKFDGMAYTERAGYYDIECGSAYKANICLRY